MGKTDWGVADTRELLTAFDAWPGTRHEKGRLFAFILRIRIEGVVASLPRSIIASGGRIDRVGRKLLLSLGEPGLSIESQRHRFPIVLAAISAHEQVCDLLHGRNPHIDPPLADLVAWSRAVDALEAEFAWTSSPPEE